MGRAGTALSATMKDALAMLREHGSLRRLPGGFWVRPGVGFNGRTPSESWHSTPTVEALVRRCLAEYSGFQGRKNGSGSFPIEVTIRPPEADEAS